MRLVTFHYRMVLYAYTKRCNYTVDEQQGCIAIQSSCLCYVLSDYQQLRSLKYIALYQTWNLYFDFRKLSRTVCRRSNLRRRKCLQFIRICQYNVSVPIRHQWGGGWTNGRMKADNFHLNCVQNFVANYLLFSRVHTDRHRQRHIDTLYHRHTANQC